jgi:hypothetical protein
LRETDLTNDAAGITDGEDGDGMAFAAGAFGAAGAMADSALEQRAAEDLASLGKLGEAAFAPLDDPFMVHH